VDEYASVLDNEIRIVFCLLLAYQAAAGVSAEGALFLMRRGVEDMCSKVYKE